MSIYGLSLSRSFSFSIQVHPVRLDDQMCPLAGSGCGSSPDTHVSLVSSLPAQRRESLFDVVVQLVFVISSTLP